MYFSFAKSIFRICVAQICQNVGWHAVQTSPMDILTDVLHRYMLEISKSVHRYSNEYGRSEPSLDDLALTFKDFGISLTEIEEYINNVEPVPFAHKLSSFPVARPSQLNSPNLGSRELLHRPEYIPEYLPLMHPELEDEEGALSPAFESGSKKNLMDSSGAGGGGESSSPLSSPKHGTKRPAEWSNEAPIAKKSRHFTEEEGRPMREVTSVFMTPTGFISPAREGKTAEASLPPTIDSPPSTPEPPSHPSDSTSSKKESKSKDSKKDKSSKSKKEKEINKKDVKKNKTSKKENKENTEMASEKSGASSFSGKKEHSSSHKSSGKSDKVSKSSDFNRKIKSEKGKFKDLKDEHRKFKESIKLGKSKSKLKHSSSGFGSSKSLKSSRLSKSPQKYSVAKSPQKYTGAKSPQKYTSNKSPQKYAVAKSLKKASSKSLKSEKKTIDLPHTVVSPVIKKEVVVEPVHSKVDAKEEKQEIEVEEVAEFAEPQSREESPEPRLIIDDSLETQARQEKESRLAVVDECINAVIQRGQEESEMETEKAQKSIEETINEVVQGPGGRRLEPKDIYDFTDSSELSSLSSLEPENSPPPTPVKKEKSKTPELNEKISENPKKSKGKDKEKKKETKPKSPSSFSSPKNRKSNSPNVIVKREERFPSPIRLKEEIYSSEGSLSSRSPSPLSPENIFDLPPPKHLSSAPSLPPPPPFVPSSSPSTSFGASPFAPIHPLPCQIQSNPHFPTPPLFVTSGKSEQNSLFQSNSNPQPLNLAKPPARSPSDGKLSDSHVSPSAKSEDSVDSKKTKSEYMTIFEKVKSKNHRKEKKEKDRVEKKEKLKKKNKEKKQKVKAESAKEKPKEKLKPKVEKVVKEEKKGKGKLEKDKRKDKERDIEKVQEDTAVPKFTLKISGGSSGSGKCVIKPSKHADTSPPLSPAPKERSVSPSPPSPTRAATPSPPPPASPPSPAPVPSTPPPPPPPALDPLVPVAVTAPVTKTPHSRGRGRGRKPAAQPVVSQARTVITETLGSIVDESGTKIWICPACTRPDDGSAMIGCDECDDWYHWVCVNIIVPPKEEESWFCSRCISKRQTVPVKRRRKKHKKEK